MLVIVVRPIDVEICGRVVTTVEPNDSVVVWTIMLDESVGDKTTIGLDDVIT